MKVSEQGVKNLAEALAKFQEEVRNPANTATNPQFRSKYAPLDVVINTAKPILAKHGLSFIQSTGAEGESISVTTLLLHESGEWIESDPLVLPAYQIKGGGVKEFNAQGAGSSLTYARRYSLSAILGLSSEDDDDANGQVFGDSKGTKGKESKDASATTSAPSAREQAIKDAQEKAAAKAAEKAVQDSSNNKAEEPPFDVDDTAEVAEPMNDAQKKAIDNMLNLIGKKSKGEFKRDEYLAEVLGKFGKGSIDELTFEQGKELVVEINTYFRTVK